MNEFGEIPETVWTIAKREVLQSSFAEMETAKFHEICLIVARAILAERARWQRHAKR